MGTQMVRPDGVLDLFGDLQELREISRLPTGPSPGPLETEASRFADIAHGVPTDTLYRDSDLIGFALRVKPSGAMTYVVQYRNSAGRPRKLAD